MAWSFGLMWEVLVLFLQPNWLSSVPSQHCWVTFEFSELLHSERLHALEAVLMLRCNKSQLQLLWTPRAFHCSNISSAEMASSTAMPVERSHVNVNPGVRPTRRNLISFWVSIKVDLPRDLKTVVFSLWAGFVPLMTSPSSAKTSAWKQYKYTNKSHTLVGRNASWIYWMSRVRNWPQRGSHRPTPLRLPFCCPHTPPPPSSARRPARASPACTHPQLPSDRTGSDVIPSSLVHSPEVERYLRSVLQ